jgi:hypothetical protein
MDAAGLNSTEGINRAMGNHITAVIADDDAILIEGRSLADMDDIADALRAAIQDDPDCILVIEPAKAEYYKGIGKVIYASQRAGMPVENLRYRTEDGEVVTLDTLRSRGSASSA